MRDAGEIPRTAHRAMSTPKRILTLTLMDDTIAVRVLPLRSGGLMRENDNHYEPGIVVGARQNFNQHTPVRDTAERTVVKLVV
jgi:hypothetical protein